MKLGKGARRFLLVALVGILVISALYSIPKTAHADNTYDFQGISNPSSTHVAYEGTDSNQPPTSLESIYSTELSSGKYINISSSDDNRAWYGFQYSDYHRFKFRIYEPVNTITQIYVEHEGYGVDIDDTDGIGPPGLTLYVWNYMTAKWEALDSHNEGGPTDGILQKTITQNIENYVDANGYLNLLAQTKENSYSCPLLYAYDGKQFVFVSDLYNRGILGVPNFPPQPEDYAKIEDYQLEQKDNSYQLQITQDYDEISYLDKIALLAIDHSPDTEIFPSFLSREEGKIFTVSKQLYAPISAIDENGVDILQQIVQEDGVYTSGKQYELNVVELDLGDLSSAEQVKLVISGYTSWENDRVFDGQQKPVDRFIQVKDENGNWVSILDGFEVITPSALPRTYVLDLTDRFLTNDYSVRIAFYPDVRFDYIGVDTSAQREVEVTTLPLIDADLHYRGYSSFQGLPAIPDYYDQSVTPPIGYSYPTGNFTRFGSVSTLLEKQDDNFVIMHHGDEISVNFKYYPIPEGSQRDFFFYSRGYYKNPLASTGRTVDPLPFSGMSKYPYPEDENYPSDSEHIAYLKEYNTREYNEQASYAELEHHTIYTDYVKAVISTKPTTETTTYVPPTSPPGYVGGELFSANKLAVLSPYLALIGVVALAAFLVRRRKTESRS